MPIEALALTMQAVPLIYCPVCVANPFTPFMRGQVQRSRWFCWAGLLSLILARPFDYCALICADCKEIVGWERPHDLQALLEKYERHRVANKMVREYNGRHSHQRGDPTEPRPD